MNNALLEYPLRPKAYSLNLACKVLKLELTSITVSVNSDLQDDGHLWHSPYLLLIMMGIMSPHYSPPTIGGNSRPIFKSLILT